MEGVAPFGPKGDALAGMRGQKVQRVQRFDTAFGREGCGIALSGDEYSIKAAWRRLPPLVPVGTTFPPLKRWDYGYSALCHMKQQVSVE